MVRDGEYLEEFPIYFIFLNATSPPKEIYIFDRTYWSQILGFNIEASLSFDWLTKNTVGSF